MININYRQLDLTNKDIETDDIKLLKESGFYIIGVEVTDVEMSRHCDINIDPQHSGGNHKSTAIESVFKFRNSIIENTRSNRILMLTIKTDIDSISSIALLTMILTNQLIVTNDLILRLNAIAMSDKHGRDKSSNDSLSKISFPGYTSYGIPISLYEVIGNVNTDISCKVRYMIDYLKYGHIKDQEKITHDIQTKRGEISKSIKYNMIIPNSLIFVESTYRGALGFGYKKAPIVIAKNDKFIFGGATSLNTNRTIGTKYTIGQYNEGYTDMNSLLNKLQEIEDGWGGSDVIIGSPQTNPSLLNSEQLINIVKSHVTKHKL